MDNLAKIIGPCPCEMTDEELRLKLTVERSRVREAIERFRTQPLKRAPKPKGLTQKKLMTQLAEAGVSIEEFNAVLKEREGGGEK
jgi:hypothetical protein